MECPNCKVNNMCGCNSCKKRRDYNTKSFEFVDGDFAKCYSCGEVNHYETWCCFADINEKNPLKTKL